MKRTPSIRTHFRSFHAEEGAVMLEFLVVLPIYMVLFSGLFILGELLVLNNRVSTTERNLTFSTVPNVNSTGGQGISWNILRQSLFGEDNWGYITDANGNYLSSNSGTNSVRRGAIIPNINLVARTPWGTCVGGWTCVQNIRMPFFIENMFLFLDILSGNPLKTTTFTLGSNQRNDGDFTGCFYTLRCNTVPNTLCSTSLQQDRAWKVQLQTTTSQPQRNGNSYAYYVRSANGSPTFLGDMGNALAYDYLLNTPGTTNTSQVTSSTSQTSQGTSSSSQGEIPDYSRLFGDFFSTEQTE